MEDKNTLRYILEKKDKFERLESLAENLTSRLTSQQAEEQEFEKLVNTKEKALHRLKGGVTSALYSLFGKKDDKIRTLQDELDAAYRDRDTSAAQVQALSAELKNVKDEIVSLGSVIEEYDRAFSEKKQYIIDNDPDNRSKIKILEEQIEEISLQIPEIKEALDVGVKVLEMIASIDEDLDAASNWGMWDMMGGSTVSGLAKHSHLDDAQNKANDLVPLLNNYRSELADVNIDVEIQVGISGIMKFADFFLDGLFADWSVLEKIHDSQKRIADVHSQVELVQTRLKSSYLSNSSKISDLKKQLENIIVNA